MRTLSMKLKFESKVLNRVVYYLSVCHVCGSYECPYCPIFSGSSNLTPNLIILLILTLFHINFIYNKEGFSYNIGPNLSRDV